MHHNDGHPKTMNGSMLPRSPKLDRRFALQVLGGAAMSAGGFAPALTFSAFASEAAIAASAGSGGRLEGGVLDPSWPPPRPIDVLVPEAQGGHANSLCKALDPRLKAAFALSVNYRYRTDAVPADLLQEFSRASLDGASLAYVDNRALVVDGYLNPGAHFSANDLQPVTWLGVRPLIVCTNRRVIAKGLREVFAGASERPGIVTFASSGRGSAGHLAGQAMCYAAGVEMLHVPYASDREAIVAAVANEVQLILLDPVLAVPEIRARRLRPLAVTSAAPLEALSEIRTAASQGLKGFEVVQWAGFAAPKGVPTTIINKMHRVLNRAIEDHDTQHDLAKAWWQPVGEGPQAFGAMIKAENERWGGLLKRMGLVRGS